MGSMARQAGGALRELDDTTHISHSGEYPGENEATSSTNGHDNRTGRKIRSLSAILPVPRLIPGGPPVRIASTMTVSALSTDLYELTMVAGYRELGLEMPATFELYARRLPPDRSFLVAAGIEGAVDYLENLRFTSDEVRYLRDLPVFRNVAGSFFDDYLPRFRFTGEVWAVDEGTPIVAAEPILRVTAPLPEAQLVETALLALVVYPTAVASEAARIVEAAAGRPVVEFGSRRAHGTRAAAEAARAAFIGGCDSTSNVEAGLRFGLPVSGTMAHSWVMAFEDELTAFRKYLELFGDRAVLLLDTYDTLAAARTIVSAGLTPAAVRLDSGDLAGLAREVRQILDAGGLHGTRIFLSGDLDGESIDRIVSDGVAADGFGVGAAITTPSGARSLGAIYKLVEIERGQALVPTMKFSEGKETLPGRKQIWRTVEDGAAVGDVLALSDEPGQGTRALLRRVMSGGRRERPALPAQELRRRSRAAIQELPAAVRRLRDPITYPVRFSARLRDTIARAARTAGLAADFADYTD
jgi:nicotinate phosphoribosyltransferase